MHYFDLTSPSAPARLVRLTICALLPAILHEASAGSMPPFSPARSNAVHLPPASPRTPAPKSAPYLVVCLPLPLRFAEPVEPAAPVTSPTTVLGPPHPGGILEEIATVNQQAAMLPSAPPPANPSVAPPSSIPSAPTPVSAGPAPVAAPAATPPVGVSILPDDTPRAVRAEDVLVYFQFPAAAPANDQPPRSSATYRQQ